MLFNKFFVVTFFQSLILFSALIAHGSENSKLSQVKITQQKGGLFSKLQFSIEDENGDYLVKQISMGKLEFSDNSLNPEFFAQKRLGSSEILLFDLKGERLASWNQINSSNSLEAEFSCQDGLGNELYRGNRESSERGKHYQLSGSQFEQSLVLNVLDNSPEHSSILLSQGAQNPYCERLLIARSIFDSIRSYRKKAVLMTSATAGVVGGIVGVRYVKNRSGKMDIHPSGKFFVKPRGKDENSQPDHSSSESTQISKPSSTQKTDLNSELARASQRDKYDEKAKQFSSSAQSQVSSKGTLEDQLKSLHLTKLVGFKLYGHYHAGEIIRVFSDGSLVIDCSDGIQAILLQKDVSPEVNPKQFGLSDEIVFNLSGKNYIGKVVRAFQDQQVEVSLGNSGSAVTLFFPSSQIGSLIPASSLNLSETVTFLDDGKARQIGKILRAFSNQMVEISYEKSFLYGSSGFKQTSLVHANALDSEVDVKSLNVTEIVLYSNAVAKVKHAFKSGWLKIAIESQFKKFPARSEWVHASNVFSELSKHPLLGKSVTYTDRSFLGSVERGGKVVRVFSNATCEVLVSYGHISLHELLPIQRLKLSKSVSLATQAALELPDEDRSFPDHASELLKSEFAFLIKIGRFLNNENQRRPFSILSKDELDRIVVHVAKLLPSADSKREEEQNWYNGLNKANRGKIARKIQRSFHPDKLAPGPDGKPDLINSSLAKELFGLMNDLLTRFKNVD